MGEDKVPRIQLSIRMEQNGEITLHGPLPDKILCLGLLELAKDLVLKFRPEEKKILVPDMIPPKIMGN